MADICPFVQILDAPVPQKVEQLADFFKGLDSHVPVQVIEVPKISQDIIPQRSVDLVPQMVEQLLEVPTVLTFYSLQQQTAEQIVDIPDPVRERRIARLQGFLPEQSSTAQQFSMKRISDRTVEQIVDTPVFRGGPQSFHPGQSSSSSSHRPAGISEDTDEPGDVVFRTFPMEKSAECSAGQCGPAPARQLMDPGGLCAAQGVP